MSRFFIGHPIFAWVIAILIVLAGVIALFNLGDRVLATVNQCPHQSGPLCDGIVTGTSVVCPLHAWKVNLTSGLVERPGAPARRCVETFPVRVHDGVVIVGLSPVAESDTAEGAVA